MAFVIASFNAEGTLLEAVSSALAQQDVLIEIVIVDDGSEDGTRELAQDLARGDPRISVLSQPNAGPGAARNRGASESRAPYLCFLDADDRVPPDKAREDAQVLDTQLGVEVVYTATETFVDGMAATTPLPISTDADELAAALRAGADRGIPVHAATLRRSAFLGVGGFREIRPLVEDLDLWTRLAAGGARFLYRDGTPVLYRRVAESRSTQRLDVLAGQIPILEWLLDRTADAGLSAALSRKLRFRALTLARLLDERGDRRSAQRLALKALRRARRPGHVLEALRTWRDATMR